jgi:hypothetical protein
LDCLAAAKAECTATSYSGTVCHFKSFCQLHGHDFPNFSSVAVLHGHDFPNFSSVAVTQFFLHQVTGQSGLSFLATFKPALTYIEQALDHPAAFTLAVDLLLSFQVPNNLQSNIDVQP